MAPDSFPEEVTAHRDGTPLHDRIAIQARDLADGRREYLVYATDRPLASGLLATLTFHNGGAVPNGLTIEVVLAILRDQLRHKDATLPCSENVIARGALYDAATALRARNRRRADQGLTGQAVPHDPMPVTPAPILADPMPVTLAPTLEDPMPDTSPAPEPSPTAARLEITADQVRIGPATITRSELETTWKAWNWAETALKRLDPPVTAAELTALEAIPTTDAGRHGLAELRSALGR